MFDARGGNSRQIVSRGDVTGRQVQAAQERKADNELARRNTINALGEGRNVVVDVPGGRSYLCPRELFDEIFRRGEEAR